MKEDALGMLLLGGGVSALVWGATRSPSTAVSPDPTSTAPGAWVFPVPSLGDRAAVISSPFKASAHLGVDIMFKRRDTRDLIAVYPPGTSNGTPLFFIPNDVPALAVSAGIVTFASNTPVGHTVIIQHPNGWTTYYTHLATLTVAKGQQVIGGQRLGTIGASPADGQHLVHLHFELWKGRTRATAIDPDAYLAAWPRLTTAHIPRAEAAVASRNDRRLIDLADCLTAGETIRSRSLSESVQGACSTDSRPRTRNGSLSTYRAVGERGEPYPEWVRALKGEAGVYVIRDAGTHDVLYVGSSAGRLYDTLTRHFQTWRRYKGFWRGQFAEGADPGLTYPRGSVEVAVRVTAPDDALDEEMRLIARLRPRDNQIGQPELEEAPF